MTDMQQFSEMLRFHDTIKTIPVQIIQQLHKQGVYVRPNSCIKNKMLPAFVMADGKEREINVQLVAEMKQAAATSAQ